jgi:hypothetical protein
MGGNKKKVGIKSAVGQKPTGKAVAPSGPINAAKIAANAAKKKPKKKKPARYYNPAFSGEEWGMGASSYMDKFKAEAQKQASALTASAVGGAVKSSIKSSGLEKTAADATTAAKDVAEKGLITAKEVSEKALVVLNKGLDVGLLVAKGLGVLTVLIILYKFYARSRTKTLNANVAYLELKGA